MKLYLLLITVVFTVSLSAQSVYINEIHYDNVGEDVGEFIEIAGPSGTDLTGWTIALYNGNSNSAPAVTYDTVILSGTIPDEGSGFGAISFNYTNLQNGGADGLSLVDNNSNVIQFLSYEGTITATDGPADTMTSTDINVSETSATPVGNSLQLSNGPGTNYSDFTWIGPVTASPGVLNSGQVFTLSVKQFKVSDFSVFPNPTSNGFVTIKTFNNQPVAVVAYDVLGKQVLNTALNTSRLNVSNLKAGVYILKLTQNGISSTKKLVVQ